jgi:subtilisin family serine protease
MKTQLLQFICKALLLCLILTLSGNLLAQDLFSYQNGKKQFYKIASDKFFIRFKKDVSNNVKKQVIGNMKALGDNNHPNGFTFISFSAKKQDEMLSLAKSYMQNDNVLAASPILLNENDKEIGALTEQFIVRLKTNTSTTQLQRLVIQTRTQIIQQYEYDKQTYILAVNKNSQGNALEMANLFYESGLFEWSEPDFLLFIEKTLVPNDTFFSRQWSANNTGQTMPGTGFTGGNNDADMDLSEAWDITTGSSNIKIAILDDGVDALHPDLAANILAGHDATGNGSGGNPTGNEAHGTACAGIAAAVGNNGQGVAGVAYNCKIVPVRVYLNGGNIFDPTMSSWIANGIDWAWNQGKADVISMSFRVLLNQNVINDAIGRAITQGRESKGSVLLAATANQNQNGIAFPASNSNVIAVGASSPCDQRKSPTSCDGETDWGSNFGVGLDIVAPGVLIATTDISGVAGYSSTFPGTRIISNDYIYFNGTSAATPHAAGVVALILSIRPCLTQAQARQALESSAEKIRSGTLYNYTANVAGQPNGTWNNEVGYGRVNAQQALIAAQGFPNTTVLNSSLISVSGQGMTVCSSGLNLGLIYNGSNLSSSNPPLPFGILEVEWAPTSGNVYVVRNQTNVGVTATAYANSLTGGTVQLRVRVRNCAGWSNWYFFNVNVCSSSGFRFAYSPNPTSDNLDVTAIPTEDNKDLTVASSIDFEAKLIDQDGKVAREGKNLNKEKKITLDVKGLKAGTYFLHIVSGKQVEKHQIVVGK